MDRKRMLRQCGDTQAAQEWRWSSVIGAVLLIALAIAPLAACSGENDTGRDEPAARLVREQTAGSCQAPPLPAGVPTPEGQNPLADVATPTPLPPAAEPTGAPSKVVAAEVTAAIRNFVNCWNQRDFEAVSTLASPSFLKSTFVLVKPQDAVIVMSGLPDVPYTIHSLSDLQQHPDGRVSAALDYRFVHQHKTGRWYFVKQNGWWLFDEEIRTRPDAGGDAAIVDVEMTDFAYALTPAKSPSRPTTALRVTNNGKLPHELVLVRIKEGVDPTRLLQPGVRPDGVEFFGQTMREPGESEEIVISGMTPGAYVLICQLRYPGGPLHSLQGMIGILTVE